MYCKNCGHDAGESNFCPSCGTQLNETSAQSTKSSPIDEEVVLWEGKPSNITDKAKTFLNTKRYKITNQRIIVTDGLIGKKEHEVDLRMVKDYHVKKSVMERVQGTGDLIIISVDPSVPELELSNISDVTEVKELLRKAVLDYKRHLGVVSEEKL